MLRTRNALKIGLLWLLLSGLQGFAEAYTLTLRDCDKTQVPDKITASQLQCGSLQDKSVAGVPVNIPFAILRARAAQADELFIVVPGGPGTGAQTEAANLRYWQERFADTDRHFDVLLYSPRGTPGAEPSFDCKQLIQEDRKIFAQDFSAEQEQEARFNALKHCLANFGTGELSSLLGREKQVADLEALIHKLPYKRVHLFGDSWGTRIVLQAHSAKIQTRLLDSVYPSGKGDLHDWLELLDFRFDIYRHKFKDFDVLWSQAVGKLEKQAFRARFKIGSESSVDEIEFVINQQRLAHIAFYALYREHLRKPFIAMLDYLAADRGVENGPQDFTVQRDDLDLLVESYLRSYFDSGFSPLAWYAAECVEHPMMNKEAFAVLSGKFSRYKYLLDGMWAYDPCQLQALRNPAETALKQTPEQDREQTKEQTKEQTRIPTLILSGELDPVTPNFWAKELHAQLGKQAVLYTAAGAGHGVIAGEYCSARLLVDFIRKPMLDPRAYCE